VSDLTPKQARVLRFIGSFVAEHGYPPTLEEMGKHFGTASPHTGFCNVLALVRKGMLTKTPRVARGLALTAAGREHLRYLGVVT
jgi:repressor LexA